MLLMPQMESPHLQDSDESLTEDDIEQLFHAIFCHCSSPTGNHLLLWLADGFFGMEDTQTQIH